MKPTLRTAARTTKPDTDPWRLGVRYRRTVGPDGEEIFEEVPLRPEDLLFPEEGDQPVYLRGHSRDCTYLEVVADEFAETRPGLQAFREHRIDYGIPGIPPLGPDISLFSGAHHWDELRGTFPVKLMRAKALLAIEVTSPDLDSLRNDLEVKVDLYFRCKVRVYAIVDRCSGPRSDKVRVLGYRATRTRYVPIEPDEDGRIWLEPLEMWLGVEKDRAICYDKHGNRIAPPNERARRAEAKAAELAKRVAELEAQLRRGRK
jgi:hypothetical protein